MNRFRFHSKIIAIVASGGLLALISGLIYWQLNRHHWCVRTLSGKQQEVVYVWGCYQPQRFRQWSVIAATPPKHLPSN